MSSYANITINGVKFCVTEGGHCKEDIKDTIQEYIDRAKEIVKKPEYIAEVVINQLLAESGDDGAWFLSGSTPLAEYFYEAEIDDNGVLHFSDVTELVKRGER